MEDFCKKLKNSLGSMNGYRLLSTKKTNKNPHTYNIKDGVFIFQTKLYPQMSCQCSLQKNNGMCGHMLYLFINIYRLSLESIYKISYIGDEVYDLIYANTLCNESVEESLVDRFKTDKCGICLEEIYNPSKSLELFSCKTCSKFVHTPCMNKWIKKEKELNKDKEMVETRVILCIYCKQSC